MKHLLLPFLGICSLGFAQPNPPAILPTSGYINYGQTTSLLASGCSGTVRWSDGQTGASINFSPKQSTTISATCTVSNQTSATSSVAVIRVGLTTSPCNENFDVNLPISNTGYRYEASNRITGTSLVNSDVSLQFKAQKYVELNAGFEAKLGSVFKASTGKCNELQSREVVNTNLSNPWEIFWGPDDFIWVTEKAGKISRINPQTGQKMEILTISEVLNYGEGGLLGMVLHPDFANNPYVYVVYNYGTPPNTPPNGVKEKVVRYTYNGSTLTNPFILLDNIKGWVNHNGSRLVITPDLKMFITTGDAADTNTPQDDNSINGKVLRINLDGTIPADNPTAGSPIWSKGHRNSQGMVYANGKLYVSSHGQNIDDEINLITQSGNYGWPNIEGICDTPSEIAFCNANSVTAPIFASGSTTWAFCGIDYYNNDTYPQWKNNLLMVSLKNQTFYTFKLSEDKNTIIGQPTLYNTKQFGRLRDIAISPTGRVYICTNNVSPSDKIIEITPLID